MRLVSADLVAYKRLGGTSVNLDAPVIAIVGPNEAGKTSLLEALAHLDDDHPFVQGDITRGVSPPSDVVRARFLLEPDDKAAVSHISEARDARWFVVAKRVGGELRYSVEPPILRDRRPREQMVGALHALCKIKWARETVADGDGATVAEKVADCLNTYDFASKALTPSAIDSLRSLGVVLGGVEGPKTLDRARERLDATIASETAGHPRDDAVAILKPRVPEFQRFDVEARSLASEYDLASLDLDHPPVALANLAALAGLDLRSAVQAVRADDYGTKLAMVERANGTLDAVFRAAWAQSATVVKIDMDETLVRVFVSNAGGGYSAIAERSDGLRAFVALIAFTALAPSGIKPILLVDEAETHLHYDAQADLVRVFTRQDAAAKVIYTTHSAGCLPEDLGSGVRVVSPIDDRDRSQIRNSFWVEGGGFSPLLLGMGASALAFASTRYAVVAEGGADVILLPSLFREAGATECLGFQVAPGLAEASRDAIAQLDLEAARVAYVVDDDDGGRVLQRKLKGAGVPPARIQVLGRGSRYGIVVEDTLAPAVYQASVNEELKRSYGGQHVLPRSAVSSRGRPASLSSWASSVGIRPPNRTAVARRVLDTAAGGQLLSAEGKSVLIDLLGDVQKSLGMQDH